MTIDERLERLTEGNEVWAESRGLTNSGDERNILTLLRIAGHRLKELARGESEAGR